MLSDSEIVSLRNNKEFKRLTKLGFKHFWTDFSRQIKDIELTNPEGYFKLPFRFLKIRAIGIEVCSCSRELLERLLTLKVFNINIFEHLCAKRYRSFMWVDYKFGKIESLFGL